MHLHPRATGATNILRITALLAALLLAGCAGSGRGTEAALSQALQPARSLPTGLQLPALPDLHAVSVSTPYSLDGSDYMDSSGATTITNHALLTPPAAGSIAWAMYSWYTQGDPPLMLTVKQTPASDTEAWIALSDYAANHWALYGPYPGQADIDLSGGQFANASDSLYCCVIAYSPLGGTQAPVDIELLQLNLDSSFVGHAISGQITGGSPALPLEGISVELMQGALLQDTVQTDANGGYIFSNLQDTSYSIIPQTADDCDPGARGVDLAGADVSGQDFNINPYRTLSGTILDDVAAPLSGVQVDLTGDNSTFTLTDANGQYSFSGFDGDMSSGDAYTLTPSLVGYTFAPLSISGNMPDADVTDADFVGSPDQNPQYTISGRVADLSDNGIAGLEIILSGDIADQAFTDGNGNYSFAVQDGNYNVDPTDIYCVPDSSPVTVNGADQTGVNFSYIPPGYTVSGTVKDGADAPVPGVNVSLTGHGSTSTDPNGMYTFNDIPDGNYTIQPAVATVPTHYDITVSGADNTGNDFVTTGAGYTVYGYIKDNIGVGVQYFHLKLKQGASELADVETDAAGYYFFSSVADGNYKVFPYTGPTIPVDANITVAGADYSVPDFKYTGPPPPPD